MTNISVNPKPRTKTTQILTCSLITSGHENDMSQLYSCMQYYNPTSSLKVVQFKIYKCMYNKSIVNREGLVNKMKFSKKNLKKIMYTNI